MEKLQHGKHDPRATATSQFPDGPAVRRLCSFHFPCPLCGEPHAVQYYITVPASGLDEFHRKLLEMLTGQDFLQQKFIDHAVEHHAGRDDLPQLLERLERDGPPKTSRQIEVEVTGETDYTCDACAGTFPTVAALRIHQGRDPETAGQTALSLCPSEPPGTRLQ